MDCETTSDMMIINTGTWGAYYRGQEIHESYRNEMDSLGVQKVDGYNEILLIWVDAPNQGNLKERKTMVYEFIKKVYPLRELKTTLK